MKVTLEEWADGETEVLVMKIIIVTIICTTESKVTRTGPVIELVDPKN